MVRYFFWFRNVMKNYLDIKGVVYELVKLGVCGLVLGVN